MAGGLSGGPKIDKSTAWGRLVLTLHELYFGFSKKSRRFRFAILVFDAVTITYFVATTVTGTAPQYQGVDVAIGLVLCLDLAARTIALRQPMLQLRRRAFYLDLLVIVALFGSAMVENLDFVRVLRLLRVLRSYRLMIELRRDFRWFRQREDVVESSVDLSVFIFITTSLVFVIERGTNPQVKTFLDALYFTIATLTTTGFGDITPDGPEGRLLSIVIMVFGVGLFLRLLQAVFRPNKVTYECPTCGLERHDLDAVHCKHCGDVLHIPTEGAT